MPVFWQTGLFLPAQLPLLLLDFTGQQFFRAPAACLRERRQFKQLLRQLIFGQLAF